MGVFVEMASVLLVFPNRRREGDEESWEVLGYEQWSQLVQRMLGRKCCRRQFQVVSPSLTILGGKATEGGSECGQESANGCSGTVKLGLVQLVGASLGWLCPLQRRRGSPFLGLWSG